MATLTVAAVVDYTTSPPRVRVDVTDAGTPAINAATVTRTDQFGNTENVRTQDGLTLPLVASGSGRAGVLWDYEAPFQVPVTYSTVQQPTVSSAAVTVNESQVWLVHPQVPDRSVTLTVAEWGSRSRDVLRGVFQPMGRSEAVAISDGRRKAPSGTLSLITRTDVEADALLDLMSDAATLLLNVPASLGSGVRSAYVSVGELGEERVTRLTREPYRRWSLPYQVVAAPFGGSQSQWTWQDVMDAAPTWQDVLNRFGTWAQVQAPSS